MSIIRWGEQGSNVYVIGCNGPDGTGDWYLCCGCGLGGPVGAYTPNAESMVAHLKEHIKAGHCVPESAIRELETDGPRCH
jgi:hypothetical protein